MYDERIKKERKEIIKIQESIKQIKIEILEQEQLLDELVDRQNEGMDKVEVYFETTKIALS